VVKNFWFFKSKGHVYLHEGLFVTHYCAHSFCPSVLSWLAPLHSLPLLFSALSLFSHFSLFLPLFQPFLSFSPSSLQPFSFLPFLSSSLPPFLSSFLFIFQPFLSSFPSSLPCPFLFSAIPLFSPSSVQPFLSSAIPLFSPSSVQPFLCSALPLLSLSSLQPSSLTSPFSFQPFLSSSFSFFSCLPLFIPLSFRSFFSLALFTPLSIQYFLSSTLTPFHASSLPLFLQSVLRVWDVYPGSDFFYPWSRIWFFSIPDSHKKI
jgi:hypothetical protein